MRSGLMAPPIACLQWAVPPYDQPQIVHHTQAEGVVEWILDGVSVGHNLAYDLACVAAMWPRLMTKIFKALDEGRILDSMIAQKLTDIARARESNEYGLAEVLERQRKYIPGCPPPLAKDSPHRLLFGTYRQHPLDAWPVDAVRYALSDPAPTALILRALHERFDGHFPGWWENLPAQVRTAFALQLTSCRGSITDPIKVRELSDWVNADLERVKGTLLQWGMLARNRNGTFTLKKARAQELVRQYVPQEKWKETKSGIAMDRDACMTYEYYFPPISEYSVWSTQRTLLAKIDDLRAGTVYTLHPSYWNPLNTGRTSCSKPTTPDVYGDQRQNPPARVKGFRECHVARPGYALVSIDFNSMELVTLAQVCIMLLGHSRLAEVLNKDIDPHSVLGANIVGGMSYDEFYARRDGDLSDTRGLAKILNFGLGGGMGTERFCEQSRSKYGVHIELDRARALKQTWTRTWPETARYFDFISNLCGGFGNKTTIRQLVTGRWRGGVGFTDGCNGFFQGLGADASNAAYYEVVKAMFTPGHVLNGAGPWGFLHDEGVYEMPLDGLHERATVATQIMIDTFQPFCPDVKIGAEPAAMIHWSKKAKTQHDSYGRLVPWVG